MEGELRRARDLVRLKRLKLCNNQARDYAPDMEHGSEDPSSRAKMVRVLTIMHSSEY